MNGDVRFSLNDVPLSLKADVELFGWNVCLGPIADIALTLGDSLPQSIRIGFSVHTRAVQGVPQIGAMGGRNSLAILGWPANSRWATRSLTKGDANPGPNRFRPFLRARSAK
jgi:hypothetical protein